MQQKTMYCLKADKRLIFSILPLLLLFSCNTKISPTVTPTYNESVNQQFWTADWSSDDELIAVAGVDSTVRIYHASSLKLYKSFSIPDWIHSVKWNPVDNILAIATLKSYVQILDVSTDRLTMLSNKPGPNQPPDGNGSRAIGWNHTGELLAVGGLDGVIKIWDKEGKLLNSVQKYSRETDFTSYLALDWHPSRNIFIAANFEIQLYDSDCRELKVMKHVNNAAIILCASWHPGGNFFVIGDYGHNWEGENVPSLLHFWSSEGQLLKSIYGSKGEYRNMDWNSSGSLLATASDVLRIWTEEGELLYQSPPDSTNYLWGISWNRKQTRIVTASKHKTIALWDNKARLLKRIDVMK